MLPYLPIISGFSGIDTRPLIYVRGLNELPTPIAGVIYLQAGFSYVFIGNVDLWGNRFVCEGDVAMMGISSETSFITSTGLPAGVPLFSTAYSIPIQNITFHDVDTCFSIIGNTTTTAVDWSNTNFRDIPNVGIVGDVANFVVEFLSFLNASGLVFNGQCGTASFINTLFSNGYNTTTITLSATANITRRFRIVLCSFVTTGTGTSLDFNAAASVPIDQFILQGNNFGGGTATHIVGILATDNRCDWDKNKGISNSRNICQYYMTNNGMPTLVGVPNTFYKIAGNTMLQLAQRFTHSNNRATCTGAIERTFAMDAIVSVTAGANNQISIAIRVYDAANVLQHQSPPVTVTAIGSPSRAANVKAMTVFSLRENDYVEVWAANSSNNNFTVEDLILRITQTL
jgi:hypothetical protein